MRFRAVLSTLREYYWVSTLAKHFLSSQLESREAVVVCMQPPRVGPAVEGVFSFIPLDLGPRQYSVNVSVSVYLLKTVVYGRFESAVYVTVWYD